MNKQFALGVVLTNIGFILLLFSFVHTYTMLTTERQYSTRIKNWWFYKPTHLIDESLSAWREEVYDWYQHFPERVQTVPSEYDFYYHAILWFLLTSIFFIISGQIVTIASRTKGQSKS